MNDAVAEGRAEVSTTPATVSPGAVNSVAKPTIWERLKTGIWGAIRWGIGALLMQHPAGALVVAGWLQRYLQRAVYRGWWKRCRGRSGRFDDFALEEPLLQEFRRAPNWVLAQTVDASLKASSEEGRFRRAIRRWTESLGRNLALGIQVVANVGVLTMPASVLWAAGWWGGWQNSFYKGYEQFGVGPVLFWLGIGLFLAAMFYVPMAVARQASTGRWRSFWEGRTIWTLVRSSWLPVAWVAVVFAMVNAVVMGLKSWPQFLPGMHLEALAKRGLDPTDAYLRGIEKVDWSNLTGPQALGILNEYYLGAAVVVFALLIVLKRLLAWLYSGAVLRAVQRGALGEDQLSDVEWRLLRALGALRVRETPARPWVVRVVAWAGSKVGRVVCGGVVVLGWFGFVGGIVVSEFLAYHPVIGWLNQPLIQLPWFRYVPVSLENPLGSLLIMALVVAITIRVWIRRSRCSRRAEAG